MLQASGVTESGTSLNEWGFSALRRLLTNEYIARGPPAPLQTEFSRFCEMKYYRLHTSAASSLKKKKTHNPQATGQNKSENCGPTSRRIDSAAVGRIKGIPIHPPEGSCSGYQLIPYSAASDACCRRCVNPAAILSSPHCTTSRAAGAR